MDHSNIREKKKKKNSKPIDFHKFAHVYARKLFSALHKTKMSKGKQPRIQHVILFTRVTIYIIIHVLKFTFLYHQSEEWSLVDDDMEERMVIRDEMESNATSKTSWEQLSLTIFFTWVEYEPQSRHQNNDL